MANTVQKRNAREWNTSSGHQGGGAVISTLEGFDRYHETARTLPLLEQIKLGLLASFIVESYRPGNFPIVEVESIGHADTDFQRGAKFENEISERRARDVTSALRDAVGRLAPIQILIGPSPAGIKWVSSGVGSTEPHPDNVRARKTPQNMTEADRKRNRRVEVLMTHGPTPIPSPANEAERIFLTLLEAMAAGNPVPPLPKPPQPAPKPPALPPWFWDPSKGRPEPRTSEYEKLKKAVEDALDFVDTDTVLKSIPELIEHLNTDKEDEKWLHDFMKEVEADIRQDKEKRQNEDKRRNKDVP